MDYIKHILKNTPHKPGIYKMKDERGQIIYVGKAKDLKNRISSYFNKSNDHSPKTVKMLEHVKDIDYSVVESELEALILETNLIKQLRPKYNILMKDDKNYVYVKITVNEDFPRIFITRNMEKDKARYFGPKTSQYKVENTLKVLKKIFPFRHCHLLIEYERRLKLGESANPKINHKVNVTRATIKYPCLDYHIKRCIGPCVGTVSKEEYRAMIDQIINFFEGKQDEIIKMLREEMLKAAAEKKFEIAAGIRNKLQYIEELMESQIVSDPNLRDLDVVNYIAVEEKAYFNLFQVREGKLINQENFILNIGGKAEYKSDEETLDNQEILDAFLEQYYEKATDIPGQVLIPHEISVKDGLEKWLTGVKGMAVHIIIPKRGTKDKLLELSLQNAMSFARQTEVKWQGHELPGREQALEKMAEIFKLPKKPQRLECYDISHFQGKDTVASMVVFEKGFAKKEDYRKFKLHQETSGSPDDFASMEETLTRRLRHLRPSLDQLKIIQVKTKKHIKDLNDFKWKCDKKKKYLIIEKEKKIAGLVELFTVKNRTLISRLELNDDLEIHLLTGKIIEKLKINRLYLICNNAICGDFEAAGFIEVKKIPEEIKVPKNARLLVIEKNKYKADTSLEKTPDLIIIDGGKGQLGRVEKVMKKMKLKIPTVSIAKREEEIFTHSSGKPLILPKDDPVLHLFQQIRDEAHRFAVSYHTNVRGGSSMSSVLDRIPGIGEAIKMKLLKRFGSIEGILKAELAELSSITGEKAAKLIKERLLG